MSKLNDLTGQKFYSLTVLERVLPNTASGNARWLCECDCGNKTQVVGTSLKNGHTKSCGCLVKKNMAKLGKIQGELNCEDISGQKFHYLTARNKIYIPEASGYKWFCECDCGGTALVKADKLKSGHTKSCGCLISYGERVIKEELTARQISFIPQFAFSDLVGRTGKRLRFDFALFEEKKLKCLIEYNGVQHYDKKHRFYSEEGIYRDKLKQEYCAHQKIPLYIIKYDEDTLLSLNNIIKMEYEEE